MTTTEAEKIRQDIEKTRAELSQDVDSLTDKVSPSRIVERRVEKAKGALSGAKEKVMGAAPSTSPSEGASAAQDKITTATAGNPLAAGLVAFGAGWVLSSLLPASSAERQAAAAAKDMISEHSDELSAPLHDALDAVKESMQEPAQEAVDAVKATASEAVATVKDDAASAKENVAGGEGPKHAATAN